MIIYKCFVRQQTHSYYSNNFTKKKKIHSSSTKYAGLSSRYICIYRTTCTNDMVLVTRAIFWLWAFTGSPASLYGICKIPRTDNPAQYFVEKNCVWKCGGVDTHGDVDCICAHTLLCVLCKPSIPRKKKRNYIRWEHNQQNTEQLSKNTITRQI